MSIVEPIVSKTSEVAYTIAFRHIGYLFQYNENIHNLEVEIDGLEDILRRINEMVMRAQRNAEVIQPDVEKWQKDANGMQDEVVAFLVNKVRSNSWCVNCWCPNPMWRYRLGKESKLKTSRVISLKEQGTKFLTVLPLSCSAPPPEHPFTNHGNKEGCCKVLITSRKQLLHMMTPKLADQRALSASIRAPVASTKEFYIPILEKEEALSLFMKTAVISVNSNEQTLSVVKEVCDECGGLPIAILAVATALKGKEWYAWQDALTLLKKSNFDQIVDIDPHLFSSLKLSYDYLEPKDARSCFLLCSLFPEDAEISVEDLVIYTFGMRLLDRIATFENVRNRVLTLVKGLKASCLLLQGRDDNTVKMHDVIRDVAILIAKSKKGYLVEHDLKKWPEGGTFEGHSVISLKSEYFSEIPSELGSQELHTLVLRSNDSSLPDSFFKGMETNLEVLDLSGMAIESLPFSLSKLVKLRMLLLPDEVSDVSLLGELKSLEILRVNGIEKLPPEIRQLTCLKFLELGEDYNLGVISPNVISNLKRLEELYIPDYFNGWEDEATDTEGTNAIDTEGRNASLVELNSLTYLTALKVHIPRGESSPNNLCFEKLVRFRISIGAPFGPDNEEKIPPTKALKLHDVPLEDKFKVLLVKSEVVYVTKVKGLENVLHERDGSGFFNLKYLEVERCDGDENLLGRPEPSLQTSGQAMSRSFCNLTKLCVANCSFKYLFSLSVARRLEQLQVLNVETCSCMEAIVGNERQGDDEEIIFPRLREMTLMDLPNLISFCPSKRPNSITEASNSDPAQPLFREKDVVPNIQEIKINGCPNPESIFSASTARKLTRLQRLVIESGSSDSKLKAIVETSEERDGANDDELFVFPELFSMYLIGMANPQSFCSSCGDEESFFNQKVVFPCLGYLGFRGLGNVKGIWNRTPPADSFQNLTTLILGGCHDLLGSDSGEGIVSRHEPTTEEVDTNVVLPRLKVLFLLDLPRLKSFCSGNKLPSSVDPVIQDCPLLETLF
ncbi:hypothetical protein Vadar_027514 [Vaccinium darrowii]|uniref:Uncharacterized protein n=1 Tax=Vaccinium darrowii TaxID=229202 RepID=A0ACB7Z743_9ERIC|nr:hypothetical protein Vadar_027514 [Vaccinium darrowii]